MVQKLTVVALIALVAYAAAEPSSYDDNTNVQVELTNTDVERPLLGWPWFGDWANGPLAGYGGLAGYGFRGNLGAANFYGPWTNYGFGGRYGPWSNYGAWAGPGLSAFNLGLPYLNAGLTSINTGIIGGALNTINPLGLSGLSALNGAGLYSGLSVVNPAVNVFSQVPIYVPVPVPEGVFGTAIYPLPEAEKTVVDVSVDSNKPGY